MVKGDFELQVLKTQNLSRNPSAILPGKIRPMTAKAQEKKELKFAGDPPKRAHATSDMPSRAQSSTNLAAAAIRPMSAMNRNTMVFRSSSKPTLA